MCQRARRVGKKLSAFRHVCFDRITSEKLSSICGKNLILFDIDTNVVGYPFTFLGSCAIPRCKYSDRRNFDL